MLGKVGFVAIAFIFAGIGAHSLNPRETLREMYPVEPVKQDAFHICDQADPTFIRAVKSEREACYNKMPHVMAVAMGRVAPSGSLTMQALIDPAREAELLMALAAMPPRQPITAPRSFSNTAWVRALLPPCDDKRALPAVATNVPKGAPSAPGAERAAALDNVVRGNLPPLPRPAGQVGTAGHDPLPVIPLTQSRSAGAIPASGPGAKPESLSAPDVGDDTPAIVPLARVTNCGGA